MMKIASLFLCLAFAAPACTKTKAPGTAPSDMTAEQHRQACLEHKRQAAEQQKKAAELQGGKGTYTAETAASEHGDVAKQHGDAGKQVDPTLADCN